MAIYSIQYYNRFMGFMFNASGSRPRKPVRKFPAWNVYNTIEIEINIYYVEFTKLRN